MIKPVKVTDMNATIQSPSLGYMREIKSYGTGFNFIKTSEGTGWPNTLYAINNIKEMMRNSLKVWGQFGVYHFWHGEDASAFLAWSKYYGLYPKSTKFMLDVEDPSTEYNIMSRINRFFKQLIDHGYNKGNLFLYCMKSWITSGVIVPSKLKYGFMWVADYPYYSLRSNNAIKPKNTNNPGYNVWQFSGQGTQDWSYAYNGCLNSQSKPVKKVHKPIIKKKPKAPVNHYLKSGKTFEVIANGLSGYTSPRLITKNGVYLSKGSRIHGQVIQSFKTVTRLDTPVGWFSTNTKYLKAVK